MKAVVVRKEQDRFTRSIESIELVQSGDPGTVIQVEYSSLNFKDALALTNRSPVVRAWPMVAGIDGAGRIVRTDEAELAPGTTVVATGWGMGETSWGCFAQQAHLRPGWSTPIPANLSARDSMAFGTAGLTAMLSIMAIERLGIKPADGPVLVTGAAGGVGGISLMLLKTLGFEAVASTGRIEEADYLVSLGAASVIDRKELSEAGKPLQKERWAAVIDSVGSFTLANACASTRYGGAVAACGLAQGMDFPGSVAPFILRGITLAGIDSVLANPQLRAAAWDRIAALVDRAVLERIVREIALEDVFDAADELLAGKVRGRLVVRVGAG